MAYKQVKEFRQGIAEATHLLLVKLEQKGLEEEGLKQQTVKSLDRESHPRAYKFERRSFAYLLVDASQAS